jgi:exopolysaccharide production protein ExoZ
MELQQKIEQQEMMKVTERSTSNQLVGIQMVRAVAAIMVAAFHAGHLFGPHSLINGPDFGLTFSFGYSGVILFFVVSGFIIMHAHWDDAPSKLAVSRYISRRLTRIFPATLAVVTILLVVGPAFRWVTGDDTFLIKSWAGIVSSVTLLPLACDYSPGVLWSLTNELYFYVVFLLTYISRKLFLIVMAAWTTIAFVSIAVPLFSASECHNYPFSAYNGIFGFGIVAYFLWLSARQIAAVNLGWVALFAGVALYAITAIVEVMYMAPRLNAQTVFDPRIAKLTVRMAYILASTAIILGMALLGSLAGGRTTAMFRALGDASFSIYLVHEPIIGTWGRMVGRRAGEASFVFSLISFLLLMLAIVLIGVATRRCVELPLIARVRSASRSQG